MDDVLLWGFIAFGVMIAVILFTLVFDLKKNGKKYEKQMEEREAEIFAEEAVSESFHAEITDMICGTGMVGSYRLPKSEKAFLIILKNDGGDLYQLRVDEEIYTSLEVGMRGVLTILEGRLDSFELDEE